MLTQSELVNLKQTVINSLPEDNFEQSQIFINFTNSFQSRLLNFDNIGPRQIITSLAFSDLAIDQDSQKFFLFNNCFLEKKGKLALSNNIRNNYIFENSLLQYEIFSKLWSSRIYTGLDHLTHHNNNIFSFNLINLHKILVLYKLKTISIHNLDIYLLKKNLINESLLIRYGINENIINNPTYTNLIIIEKNIVKKENPLKLKNLLKTLYK